MIGSATPASEPQVPATSRPSSAASAHTGGTSEPKLAEASRRSVLAAAVDAVTLAPETPSQAPQSDNVRKCPVLSGPTAPDEQTDLSPDNQTTCDPNPSYPDQTFAGHHAAQPSQPKPPNPHILI